MPIQSLQILPTWRTRYISNQKKKGEKMESLYCQEIPQIELDASIYITLNFTSDVDGSIQTLDGYSPPMITSNPLPLVFAPHPISRTWFTFPKSWNPLDSLSIINAYMPVALAWAARKH